MNEKIQWLRNKMSLLNLQGMIVASPSNIKYLTGLDAEGTLLITRKENFFLTDARYIEAVKSTLTIDDGIIVNDVANISLDDYENYFMFCENVGFEENYVTYAMYKKYMQRYKIHNLEETEYLFEKQRMIKDEEEINLIQKACNITDECFKHICNFIKIGKTEKEIAFEIDKFFIEHGSDGPSFETIVVSGKNSSKPHGVPTDKKIEAGDTITITVNKLPELKKGTVTANIKTLSGYTPKLDEEGKEIAPESVKVEIKAGKDDSSLDTVYSKSISPATESISAQISGIGTITVKVYIDGVLKGTKQIDLNSTTTLSF